MIDLSGDPAIQLATQAAIDEWNRSGVLTLTWTSSEEGCRFLEGAITVCKRDTGHFAGKPTRAVARPFSRVPPHLDAVRIDIDDRPVQTDLLAHLLCHEIGHGVGLHHSPRASSCMNEHYETQAPDEHDYEQLRAVYDHPD